MTFISNVSLNCTNESKESRSVLYNCLSEHQRCVGSSLLVCYLASEDITVDTNECINYT